MRPDQQVPVMSACYALRVATHDLQGVVAATQTDHIIPHRAGVRSPLFWDQYNNWQSLCAACGARKSRAGL